MPISIEQNNLLKKLGLKVKELRLAKGYTLKDLAHSIGKDAQSVHRLETGKINPSYLYLKEVCEGLEIKLSDLLSELE